jgi:hypothetical protein
MPVIRSAVAAGAIVLLSGSPVLAQAPAPAAKAGETAYDLVDPGHLAGVWLILGYKGSQRYTATERTAKTVEDKLPPMQPWAAQLLQRRIADSNRGEPFANTVTNCLPAGMPEMMFGGITPIEIIPMRGEVVILTEELDLFRHIYMNEPQAKPEDLDPTYMGHSVGRWDGQDLVVDTIGVNDKTTIDGVGMAHTEAMRVTERYHRAGDKMDITVTIDDPKTFTAPWTTKVSYQFQPTIRLTEFVCDNNRNATVKGESTGFSPSRR